MEPGVFESAAEARDGTDDLQRQAWPVLKHDTVEGLGFFFGLGFRV